MGRTFIFILIVSRVHGSLYSEREERIRMGKFVFLDSFLCLLVNKEEHQSGKIGVEEFRDIGKLSIR